MVIQDYLGREICLDGKILAFDLDGVLADSVEKKLQAWHAVLPKLDRSRLKQLEDLQNRFSNVNRSTKIELINKQLYEGSLDESFMRNVLHEYSVRVTGIYKKCDWIKGAKSFVESQKAQKFIVSSAPGAEASFFLDQENRKLFKEIFFDIEDKAKKLSDLARSNSENPSKIVFFGDKKTDLIAGQAAGTYFVAINWKSSNGGVKKHHKNFYDTQ